MAVVKVIELLGESEQGWEDAARKVVEEATRTLHGVTSVYVKEFQDTVGRSALTAALLPRMATPLPCAGR